MENKKAKLKEISYFDKEYFGDEIESYLSGEEIILEFEKESYSYELIEDAVFERSVNTIYKIKEMIKLAHKLGMKGIDIEYVSLEESIN